MTPLSLEDAKQQAKALRAGLSARGVAISHAQALELIAVQHGARDWNTLHARIGNGAPCPFHLHQRVRGRYLGQPFTGRLTAISRAGEGYSVAVEFDEPVDTVKFESFSNLRSHVRGVIDRRGHALRRTSDGAPQLIVEPAG